MVVAIRERASSTNTYAGSVFARQCYKAENTFGSDATHDLAN